MPPGSGVSIYFWPHCATEDNNIQTVTTNKDRMGQYFKTQCLGSSHRKKRDFIKYVLQEI